MWQYHRRNIIGSVQNEHTLKIVLLNITFVGHVSEKSMYTKMVACDRIDVELWYKPALTKSNNACIITFKPTIANATTSLEQNLWIWFIDYFQDDYFYDILSFGRTLYRESYQHIS